MAAWIRQTNNRRRSEDTCVDVTKNKNKKQVYFFYRIKNNNNLISKIVGDFGALCPAKRATSLGPFREALGTEPVAAIRLARVDHRMHVHADDALVFHFLFRFLGGQRDQNLLERDQNLLQLRDQLANKTM